MSDTLTTRVQTTLQEFGDAVTAAESVTDNTKETRRAIEHVAYTRDLLSLSVETDSNDARSLLDEVIHNLSQTSGVDRTIGDGLAAKVRALVESGMDDLLPDGTIDTATDLLTRWAATSKGRKSSGGSGGGNKGDFLVTLKCSCGHEITDRTNANSARWTFTRHLAKDHGMQGSGKDGRWTKGEGKYDALTAAIKECSSVELGDDVKVTVAA